MAIPEVDVERRTGEVRAAHDLVHRELPEGLFTQKSLRGCDDLAFRNFRGPSPPPCGNPSTLILGVHGLSLPRRFTILEPL